MEATTASKNLEPSSQPQKKDLDTLNFRVCHRDQSSNKSLFDFIYVCLLQIPFSDMLEENWNRLGRDESMNEYNLTKHCGTIQVRGKDLQLLPDMLL